jgi:hypothetical protein
MFGRGYFSLGMGDKMAVDQVVQAAVGGYYSAVTPEFLARAPVLLGECWQRYAVAVRRFRTVEATRRMERSCPPRHIICGAP